MANEKMTKEQALQLLQSGDKSLKDLSDELLHDREIVLVAVKEYGGALQYAAEELRSDQEIVLYAVKKSGGALQYVSQELRNFREIVLAAVKESGYALKYASEELRNDQEIVMAAIDNHCSNLLYASELLRSDKAFLKPIIKENNEIWNYVSEELRNDREFYLQIFKPYKICIPAGKFVLVANGPLLNLDSEKSGDYVSHTKKVALNLRVVDNNGIAITPIISEMVVCKHYYEHTSYYNDLEAGYLIYNNEIFFRSEDKFDKKSSENIGLNKILTENNAACSLEELKKFLQPCEPITDEDKVVMLHKYVSHIMDFQQHYEVSEINKDKMNWDGETLTIHTL